VFLALRGSLSQAVSSSPAGGFEGADIEGVAGKNARATRGGAGIAGPVKGLRGRDRRGREAESIRVRRGAPRVSIWGEGVGRRGPWNGEMATELRGGVLTGSAGGGSGVVFHSIAIGQGPATRRINGSASVDWS